MNHPVTISGFDWGGVQARVRTETIVEFVPSSAPSTDRHSTHTTQLIPGDERLCQSVVEASPDPIAVLQGDRLHLVNPSFLKLLAAEADQVFRRPLFDFICSDHREVARLCLDSASGTAGEPAVAEVELVDLRGLATRVELVATSLPSPDRLPIILVNARDLTERSRLTDSLRQREAHLQAIIESEPECVKRLSRDGQLRAMNPAGLRMIQAKSFDEVANHCVFSLLAEPDREAFQSLLERVFEGQSGTIDFQCVGLQGANLWLESHVAPLRNERGEITEALAITRDITERKLAEAAIQRERQQQQRVLEHAPVAVWYEDFTLIGEWMERLKADGICDIRKYLSQHPAEITEAAQRIRVIFVNQAAVTQCAANNKEELINNVPRLLTADSREAFLEELIAIWEGRSNFEREFSFRRLDGSIAHMIVSMHIPLAGDRLNLKSVILTATDITNRKQAEKLLRGQKQVLEMITADVPLRQSLEALVRVLEEHSPDVIGSILLLDAERRHLNPVAGPNLPVEYSQALNGLPIGPGVGSCGRAAFCGCPVVVQDITTDPLWAEFKHLALPYGLRACWSVPIFDSSKQVLGTFAIYFREPKVPTDEHWRLIDLATHTAAIAISKQRREDVLRESQLRWQMVIEQLPAVAWTTDLDMRFTLSSGKGLEALRLRKNEVVGRTLYEFFQTDDSDYLPIASHRRAFAGESTSYFVNWQQRWFETHVRPLQNDEAQVIGAIGIALDVTDKKLAQEELHRSEERYRTLVEQAGDAIFIVDHEQCLQVANQRARELFGYERAEFQGMPLSMIVAPSEQDQQTLEFGRVLANERILSERLFRRSDGSLFSGELSACRLTDGRVLGIVRDISDRKRTESELRNATNRLQSLSRELLSAQEAERRRVARELHDELGQVLTGINLSLQTAKTLVTGAAASRIDESLEIVDQAIRQVRNLALDLRPSMLDDFGLDAALEWYFDRQRLRSGLQIQLTKQLSAERLPAEIETICFRVAQEAFTNVARHAHATIVEVRLTTTSEVVELFIRDNGIGFDVNAARDRASHGGSLGLLSMSERVQLAGGRLEIVSKSGEGTTITAVLPK